MVLLLASTSPLVSIVMSGSEVPLTPSPNEASSGSLKSSTDSVKCGTATGILYIDKINAPGNEGSLKCIHSGSNWYSPIGFEILGVRLKSRNWRHSIMHENFQLGVYLSSIGIHPDKPSSPSPNTGSTSTEVAVGCQHIVDPALAFIKDYRLMLLV